MNKQSSCLLTILSKCRPEDEELALASRRSEILQSPAYKKLKRRTSYKKIFDDILSEEKLNTYNSAELESLQQSLPVMDDFLQNLIYSLSNGCCPKLTEADRPSFMDSQALEKLSERLEDGTGRNYCNIEPVDCMKIFDADTVKSINGRFLDLPEKCEDYTAEIEKLYPGKSFCISEAEIQELEQDYQGQIELYIGDLKTAQNSQFRRKLIMLAVTLAALMIPWYVGRMTGSISDTALYLDMLGILLAAIISWKRW